MKQNILFGGSHSSGNALLGTGLHSFVDVLVKWLMTTDVSFLWQMPVKEWLQGMEIPVGCVDCQVSKQTFQSSFETRRTSRHLSMPRC